MFKQKSLEGTPSGAVPIEVDGRSGDTSSLHDPRRSSGFGSQDGGRDSMHDERQSLFSTQKRDWLWWLPKEKICRTMNTWRYQTLTLILVMYSLFVYNVVVYVNAPNSVDPWINASLLLCMAVFLIEVLLNVVCQPHPPWFLLFLDVLATATIVVDLSWVASAVGLDDVNGSKTSDAAAISARAGRIIRLVRLLRLLRVVSLLSVVAKQALQERKRADAGGAGAPGDGAGPSNIGAKLTDAMTVQVALVVILTVIATALLTSWGVQSSAYDAYVASFQSQVGQPREFLDQQVEGMLQYVDDFMSQAPPLTLRVGQEEWTWVDQEGGYSRRKADTATFSADSPVGEAPVVLEVDVSALNTHDALLDILLIVLVLVVLLGYVGAVNITIYKTLVRPLERIFNSIRTNAAQVVAALGPAEGGQEEATTEDGDIGTIEAAVQKMSRIIAHYTGSGGQGSGLVATMAADADDRTKEWLATMVGESVKKEPTADGPSSSAALEAVPRKGSTVSVAAESPRNATLGAQAAQGVRKVRTSLFGNDNSAAAAAAAVAAAAQLPSGGGRESGTSSSTGDRLSRPVTGSFGATLGAGRNSVLAHLAQLGGGLTDDQREALLAVDVDALHSFKFDMLSLDRASIAPHLVTMFVELGLAHFSGADALLADDGAAPAGPCVDVAVLWRFIDEVSTYYKDVPYHNFFHCADVSHATFLLIDRLRAVAKLTQVECFALMVAALAHDMDHPGVNNQFLVSSRHSLACTYNDASVLENRHVACLYALVGAKPEIDIFAELEVATWKEVRKLIIAAVLHTDMTQHFPMVSKLEVFLELKHADIQAAHAAQRQALRTRPAGTSGGSSSVMDRTLSLTGAVAAGAYSGHAASTLPCVFATPEERILLLQLILHSADISNPARPVAVCEKWADRVLGEFFAQGDRERALGQPITPLCDRATTSRPGSQVNFIEFVVAPLFAAVARIFPDAGELVENTAASRQFWQLALVAELSTDGGKTAEERAAEVTKAEGRLAAFQEKHKEALGLAMKRRRDLRRRMSSTIAVSASGSAVDRISSTGMVPVTLHSTRSSDSSASFSRNIAPAGSPRTPSSATAAAAAAQAPSGSVHRTTSYPSGTPTEMAAAVAAALLTRSHSATSRGPSFSAGAATRMGGGSRAPSPGPADAALLGNPANGTEPHPREGPDMV